MPDDNSTPQPTSTPATGGESASSGADASGGFTEPVEVSGASWAAAHFAAMAKSGGKSANGAPDDRTTIESSVADSSDSGKPSGKTGQTSEEGSDDLPDSTADQSGEVELTPEAAVALVSKLKAAAKDGNFEALLGELGINPDGLKVPSSRFAELRKQQKSIKEQAARDRAQIEGERTQIRTEVARFIEEHKPFAEARDHFKRGDLVRAMEAAFGLPFDKLQERALEQKLAASPEGVMAMTRLEQMEREKALEKQRLDEQKRVERDIAEVSKYCQDLAAELKSAAIDPIVRKAAERPDFPGAVYRAQRHAYQTEGALLTSEEAAKRVLEVVRKAHADWASVFGTVRTDSANSDQTATQSENTDRAGIAPESQQGRRNGVRQKAPPAPPVPKSDAESLAFWRKQMETSLAKDRAARK
jgi:hypothetical protein